MDSPATHAAHSVEEEEDEWDADGFVIPSLGIGGFDENKFGVPEVDTSKAPSSKAKAQENIYLGPHGAPPSQVRQVDANRAGRRQKFKQKLKEADRRTSGIGHENKLENLRELVGGGNAARSMPIGSSRDWLDPHCNESQFDK